MGDQKLVCEIGLMILAKFGDYLIYYRTLGGFRVDVFDGLLVWSLCWLVVPNYEIEKCVLINCLLCVAEVETFVPASAPGGD